MSSQDSGVAGPISKVGFVGLGIMGQPMARNLLKAGFSLVVHSRTRASVDALAALGAAAAASPAEVARATDLVVTMVPDSSDVELVAAGPGGVFEGAHPGLVVADMSTISPATARRLSLPSRLASSSASCLGTSRPFRSPASPDPSCPWSTRSCSSTRPRARRLRRPSSRSSRTRASPRGRTSTSTPPTSRSPTS